jgi:hypothetical protein
MALLSRLQTFFRRTSRAEISALKHVLVEREVGDQLFEAGVLSLQLLQATQLGYAHSLELPFPSVEGLLANAGLAADLDGRAYRSRLDAGRKQSLRR